MKRMYCCPPQPMCAAFCKLLLGVIVADKNQLLLTALQFHLRAQRIDGRDHARLLLVRGSIGKRLRSFHLRFGGFNSAAPAMASR